ncbi:MAG: serine hydrolase domain-containing protein [Xanthomonadales bacterium]|nr:serine hydrolase domain-containing protein [Xanthomonadales bacterium]
MYHPVKTLIAAVLMLGTSLPLTETLKAADAASVQAVDTLFADYDTPASPGCALGVIRDGQFVYRRGYGMANLEHDIPLSSRSVFRIGSTSKQFTAAAVALLAEEGELSLDDSLRRHFPEFPDWADEIIIRQLIHHSSGLRDYLTLAELAGRGGDADSYSDEWVLELLSRQQALNFPPGSSYLYSNSGYLLLAHLVQRVSGKSLREYSAGRIFGPLGMGDSHFHDDHTHIVPHRAAGYAPTHDGFRISMTTLDMVGDGGVYTTVDDLLAWDRNFYDNRLGRGGAELIRQLTTPGKLNSGEPLDYAFGLRVRDYRGLPTVSHGGAFVGFRAEMLRFPEQAFSVVALCNRADADPGALARAVADHHLAAELAPLPDTAAVAADEQQPSLSTAELARYAGYFWEPDEAILAQVRVIDGELWAVHSPQRRDRLLPVGPDRFRMTAVPGVVLIDFEMSGERVARMKRTVNGQPRGVFRPVRLRRVVAGELAAYAGRYYSPELDVHYEVTDAGDRLRFSIGDGPAHDLPPVFGETFENPDYGAFEFRRGDAGSITGFELQSGRVRGLVFKRS